MYCAEVESARRELAELQQSLDETVAEAQTQRQLIRGRFTAARRSVYARRLPGIAAAVTWGLVVATVFLYGVELLWSSLTAPLAPMAFWRMMAGGLISAIVGVVAVEYTGEVIGGLRGFWVSILYRRELAALSVSARRGLARHDCLWGARVRDAEERLVAGRRRLCARLQGSHRGSISSIKEARAHAQRLCAGAQRRLEEIRAALCIRDTVTGDVEVAGGWYLVRRSELEGPSPADLLRGAGCPDPPPAPEQLLPSPRLTFAAPGAAII